MVGPSWFFLGIAIALGRKESSLLKNRKDVLSISSTRL